MQPRVPLVADWPGYFPKGPAVVRLLIDNGADPNGGAGGPLQGRQETPLHWVCWRGRRICCRAPALRRSTPRSGKRAPVGSGARLNSWWRMAPI